MPRRYSMEKRGRATKRTRRRIELALIELLAVRPFSAITVADIAASADVSARTVQRHYASKDAILAACVSFPARSLAEEFDQRPPAPSPEAALRDLISGLFSFYEANRRQAWAVYSRAQDVPVLEDLRQASIRARDALVERLIENWPEAWGDERTARAAILAMTALGTFHAFTDVGRFTTEDATEFIARALERTLLK
jgi:AcrR family transcriptional regulator